jgi:hypothetical protein
MDNCITCTEGRERLAPAPFDPGRESVDWYLSLAADFRPAREHLDGDLPALTFSTDTRSAPDSTAEACGYAKRF